MIFKQEAKEIDILEKPFTLEEIKNFMADKAEDEQCAYIKVNILMRVKYFNSEYYWDELEYAIVGDTGYTLGDYYGQIVGVYDFDNLIIEVAGDIIKL